MSTTVIYHKDCADGFTAAWAAWRALGDKAEYIPAQYGEPIPDCGDATHVYLLDICYPKDLLIDKFRHCKLTVLDHHKSAKADLADLLDRPPRGWNIVFDMEKSGAMLAWEHFHPGSEAPRLVEYVQDRDLWQWKLPDSAGVNAVIDITDKTFDGWDWLEGSSRTHALALQGEPMIRYKDAAIQQVCERAGFTILNGHKVPCVNTDPIWRSEVGNILGRNAPFAVVWYTLSDGTYIYSLRSDKDRPDEVVDVSEVAQLFGGGGHRHAASFRASAPPVMVGGDNE